ncbi:oxalate decarboxylase (plasmid) [Candidatus Pantoea edessiphila]|uniref:Oxalate decarboxylase n=1 Tax=Candidatus Pantoea edessiphila TaxID=2044610 RepID=A0A2P5SXA4_9GAMM|nr:cupin domain-containing protein [Candidatus Pantoea edessiphila]MBK4775893.1 cupin domain-containing protein [Pantoea sp. Edef]PPI86954.1 oxalate decarboxylase [Candidatus Pantoea edessiphila]
MSKFSRRNFMKFALSSTLALAATKAKSDNMSIKNYIEHYRQKYKSDPGPKDFIREQENPNITNPPNTDNGTLPNLRYSFSDAHIRKYSGGWTRQITQRELGIAATIAGVNMRLNYGGIRELHWHKESEWAYMIYGNARVTALDNEGNWFIDDVEVGDLWYFPPGIPHSIQGIGSDGCEFILAFDSGLFDEESTFLLSDWFKHIPSEILAKNFNVSASTFNKLPSPNDRYIFSGNVNGNLSSNFINKSTKSNNIFTYKMLSQKPIIASAGKVRIVDSSIFLISKTISAALIEIEPGGIRELHWHPNNDEWQYYIEGVGRMGVFASSGHSRTFDYRAGDVGYVPFAMGHYIENTGESTMKFLELFNSNYYADISLNQWLANTPNSLLKQHLNFNKNFINSLSVKKNPIVK